MKKYLMTGIAALTFSGLFTSCSHDMDQYTGGNVTENIQKDYETKFVSRFGEPASTQDWGFGSSSVAGVRGGTRADAVVTGDPFTNYENTDSYYKDTEDVPESAVTYSDFLNQDRWRREDWGGALDNNAAMNSDAEILLPEGEHTIKFTGGNHDFYVTGDATLNVPDYINAARIFVLPGKTFTLNMSNYINALEIYVADRATLNYNYDKLYNQIGDAIIFNRGTINLKKDNFELNQSAIIYNEGTINGKNITSKPGDNNPSFFYNYGTVELTGKHQLNSCANFFNEGTFTVAGETELTQGNSQIWWINKGTYTTGSFKTAAWNGTMYNFCSMFVTGDAYMTNGQFHQMTGSYMEANRGLFNNFQFIMANGSGVNIKQGTKWGQDGADFRGKYDWPHQGFVAVDDNAKVWVRLGGTNYVSSHKGSAFHTEGANLTFGYEDVKFYEGINIAATWNGSNYWNETSAQKLADAKSENSIWDLHNVTKVYTGNDFSQVTVTPKANDCGATWSSSADEIESVRVIAEDLTVNDVKADFDFNDVVFDVIWNKKKKGEGGKVSVKVLAAGGELTLYIGGTADGVEGVRTVNDRFKEANPEKKDIITEKTMINTAAGYHNEYNTFEFDLSDNEWEGDNINAIAKSIYVRVMKSNALTTLPAEQGKATAKIAVGTDFDWCDERQNIDEKFENFTGFVKGEYSWDTWYKNQNQNQ